jgi:hypothetical protein
MSRPNKSPEVYHYGYPLGVLESILKPEISYRNSDFTVLI